MLIAAKVTDPSKCTFGKRTDIPGMGQFDELSKLKVLSPPSPSSDAASTCCNCDEACGSPHCD
jgi:hypothetical protein